MVAHDLAAHDLVELVLQFGELARQTFELVVRDHADLRVLQRHRIAGVVVGADAIKPEQLAGHLETGDLIAPVLRRHPGLEEAGANRIERQKSLSCAEQRFASCDGAPVGDQGVESLQILARQANRQTQLTQVATGAGHFEGFESKSWRFSSRVHSALCARLTHLSLINL